MGPERYRAVQKRELARRRRLYREEVETTLEVVRVLQRRGFTMGDIAWIAGLSNTTVERWMRREVRPTRSGIAKVYVVLAVTAAYKAGPVLAYRRRWPHPDRELLRMKAAPEIARIDARRKGK